MMFFVCVSDNVSKEKGETKCTNIQQQVHVPAGYYLIFIGGCNGNTQGVSKLVEGMTVDEVVNRLKGIKCGFKPTSCPDQLATALMNVK